VYLQAEGIFRINPENDQEEHVRDQLNKGVVPENIDVHCLASLIKVHLSSTLLSEHGDTIMRVFLLSVYVIMSQEWNVQQKLLVLQGLELLCICQAWFRELPEGVLDSLSPEQVLQCNSEEEFLELVTLLRPTPAALLNWAVELMADVVEEEELNKMNARNIAMVFAPNMTQVIIISVFLQGRTRLYLFNYCS
jgi:hypothetical protein